MKSFVRIVVVVLSLALFVALTAFSNDVKKSEKEAINFIMHFDDQLDTLLKEQKEKPDEIDFDFLLELYEIFSIEHGFIKIEVEFNEYYELFTYTPIFEGISDTPLEPGMTYCQCYGTLMREIVMDDGLVKHEMITEEDFMRENSYCIVSDGEYFKISFSSDGLMHEQSISLDEYLNFYEERMMETEFNDFSSAVLYTYSLLNGFSDIDNDNSVMAVCAPGKHDFPSIWKPNKDFCHRACSKCSTPDRINHAISVGSSIDANQHEVKCPRCNYVHRIVGHNLGNWFSNSSSQHRRNCVQGVYVPCSYYQNQNHTFTPNRTCLTCGHGLTG